MYVDCVDALILEVVQNGNNASLSPLAIELITYAQDNFFTYISCFRLDHSSLTASGFIVGDPLYDLAIQSFIKYAHAHSIQVGMVVSGKNYLQNIFQTSNFYSSVCNKRLCPIPNTFPFPEYAVMAEIVNPTERITPQKQLRSELLKSCLRAQDFTYRLQGNNSRNLNSEFLYYDWDFDWISIEFEYWSASTFDAIDKNNNNQFIYSHNDPDKTAQRLCYEDYLLTIQYLNSLKMMSCSSFKIETELSLRKGKADPNPPLPPLPPRQLVPDPAIQAEEIDYLVDRILLIDYHPDPTALFDYQCSDLDKLGRSATIPNSRIWPLFSAESRSFQKACWGTAILDPSGNPILWNNYLGDYLITPHSFFSVENQHLSELNAAITNMNFYCPYCVCTFNNGNNNVDGYMWFIYSILNDRFNNHVFHRDRNINAENETATMNYEQGSVNIYIPEYKGNLLIRIYDSAGKIIVNEFQPVNNYFKLPIHFIESGIYFVSAIGDNNQIYSTKIFIK